MARVRGTGEWVEAEHVGWAPSGAEAQLRFDVAAGPHLRMVGRGPALFAEDQRVLEAFAGAARTAYEGIQLSGRAAAAQTLADVDRQRTALLAAVGHDLRTPLAGIKAAVGTFRQTDVEWSDAEREELLATIEDSSDRLDGVVRNLLDASRLQAGASTVQTDAVALDEAVSAAILALPEAAGRVAVDVPEDLPLLSGDRGLLHRILVNVIENALRHGASTEPIEVSATAGGAAARIEIADHGRGVDPAARRADVRAVSTAGRSRRWARTRSRGRARVRRGNGRRDGRRRDARRGPDDANPPRARAPAGRRAGAPMTRVLVCRRRARLVARAGGEPGGRVATRSTWPPTEPRPSHSPHARSPMRLSSTSACPTSTGSRSSRACVAGPRRRSSCSRLGPRSTTRWWRSTAAPTTTSIKPFGMDELLARLRAALRRRPANEDAPLVETPAFTRRPGGKAGRRARRRAHPPDADRVARARALGP